MFPPSAGLKESAPISLLHCTRRAGAFKGCHIPSPAVVALDAAPSVPLEPSQASAFLDGRVKVLTPEALLHWQAGVSTPVGAIWAYTLVVNRVPYSPVAAPVRLLAVLTIPLVPRLAGARRDLSVPFLSIYALKAHRPVVIKPGWAHTL